MIFNIRANHFPKIFWGYKHIIKTAYKKTAPVLSGSRHFLRYFSRVLLLGKIQKFIFYRKTQNLNYIYYVDKVHFFAISLKKIF